MKLFFIISALLSVTAAQQEFLQCNYLFDGRSYICELRINNPNGLNNFTEIGGIHLDGFSNTDTELIFRSHGVSTNIPSIICQSFPNLVRFEFANAGLTKINADAFDGCSRLTDVIFTNNRVSSIAETAFINLPGIEYMSLDYNSLTTLPENVFANQQYMVYLYLNNNLFDDLPDGIFRHLENVQVIDLGYARLTAINSQWFANNSHLRYLYLAGNRISLSADSLTGLDGLNVLNLAYNAIAEIPAEAFVRLPSLEYLYLYGNSFTELQANSFPGLANLRHLDITRNPIGIIHDGAFRGLVNLSVLVAENCRLRQLHSNSFEDLENLNFIYLNLNELEELPQGMFVPSPNLYYVGVWNNRLKTLRRNSFGTPTNLHTLDLDENLLNALDRAIIDDAVNLNTLYFSSNLCASNYFGNFLVNRMQFLSMLERCFSNMRYIIETTTKGNQEFSFFEGPHPGIAFRVNSGNEVQIALTPFNFVWNPIVEIFIGASNNTRSVIRMNQEGNVVTVPTPNIMARNQWNDFRVTWANQVILVYSGNNSFPFMSFTMREFFPVNFYGLRAM